MLVALSLCWGLSWPAMRIALGEVPPFSMRLATSGIAAAVLFAIGLLQRRRLRIEQTVARVHLAVSGFLNVACFTLLTAFAQLATATSRVAVLTYTMPIWAAVLAFLVLGERLNAARGLSLVTGGIGLSVLIYPLIGSSDLFGVALAVTTALTWAAGTVYLKWAKIEADPLAIAAWQLVTAVVVSALGVIVVEGAPHLWPIHPQVLLALIFAALVGSAISYLLWFEIVRRLPATTAALGVLGAPAVGFVSSVLVLGERPTLADIIGSLMILAAAAFAVLPASSRRM